MMKLPKTYNIGDFFAENSGTPHNLHTASFVDTIKNASSMQIALCTYHQHDDEKEFSAMLSAQGYAVKPSDGYMIFYYDKKLKAPYLRRSLIRATKG